MSEFSGATTSSLSFYPGNGFYIANRQFEPQTILMYGYVVLDDEFTLPVYPGLNLLSYPYASKIEVNATTFAEIGQELYEISGVTNKEYILQSNSGTEAWLENDIYNNNYLKWINSIEELSSLELNIGEGFWYMQQWTNVFYWSESIPYYNYFPVNTNPPVVIGMNPNNEKTQITLEIETTGEYQEEIEIYYQDLTMSQSFHSLGWNIGETKILTQGATLVEWTDAGSSNRPSIDNVFSRYYLVGRGDIDSDNDTLPDSREIYVYGTAAFDSDTDNDGLDDGDEIAHNSNPVVKDTDSDGISDGLEVDYNNSPIVSNAYTLLPFTENFETNTVAIGSLDDQNNWEVNPSTGAVVQTNIVYKGKQSMKILSQDTNVVVQHLFASPTSSVVWLDFLIDATAAAVPAEVQKCAALFGFNSDGYVWFLDGDKSPSDSISIVTNVSPFAEGEKVRLSVKLNYETQKWLICINGLIAQENIGFATFVKQFTALKLSGGKCLFDGLTIAEQQPSGLSLDYDNMPDDWEIENFGNTDQGNDDDHDGDGLSNIQEYLLGLDPTSVDTDLPNQDTDGDGYLDVGEAIQGFDPQDELSYPKSEWAHRLKLSIKEYLPGVSNKISNIPVSIILDRYKVDYSQFAPNGQDIIIDDASGNDLCFEISSWSSYGSSVIWVLLPEVDPESNLDYIWLHWGNNSYINEQSPTALNQNHYINAPSSVGVWSNAYTGVWHLESKEQLTDSSQVITETLNLGLGDVPGLLGNALQFARPAIPISNPDYVYDYGNNFGKIPSTTFSSCNSEITISMWLYGFYQTGLDQSPYIFIGKANNFPNYNEISASMPGYSGGVYSFCLAAGENYLLGDKIYKAINSEQYICNWTHWTFTKNTTTGVMNIYLDGELWQTGVGKNQSFNNITDFCLGSDLNMDNRYHGLIDEFWVSDVEHSPEWIKLQYLAMLDDIFIYGDGLVSIASVQDGEETGADAIFKISRSSESTNFPLVVEYRLTDNSTAIESEDFVAISGEITIPAGEQDQLIEIEILDDVVLEGNEIIELSLLLGSYSISSTSNTASILIIDNTVDTDNDGMLDSWEIKYGLDPLDPTGDNGALGDPDNDGLTNLEEMQIGTDPKNADKDGDGLFDGWEVQYDFDPLSHFDSAGTHEASDDPDEDGLTNLQEQEWGTEPYDSDTDNDDLSDGEEVNTYGTNPLNLDTDGDGTSDSIEVYYGFDPNVDTPEDYDNDELTNSAEYSITNPITGEPLDATNSDTDGDGLNDGWEIQNQTNPFDKDTDVDADGTYNIVELYYGFDPSDGVTPPDWDKDGLSNNFEYYYTNSVSSNGIERLNARLFDSDGDKLPDLFEVMYTNFNPCVSNSFSGEKLTADIDGDGLDNAEEMFYGTDPNIVNVEPYYVVEENYCDAELELSSQDSFDYMMMTTGGLRTNIIVSAYDGVYSSSTSYPLETVINLSVSRNVESDDYIEPFDNLNYCIKPDSGDLMGFCYLTRSWEEQDVYQIEVLSYDNNSTQSINTSITMQTNSEDENSITNGVYFFKPAVDGTIGNSFDGSYDYILPCGIPPSVSPSATIDFTLDGIELPEDCTSPKLNVHNVDLTVEENVPADNYSNEYSMVLDFAIEDGSVDLPFSHDFWLASISITLGSQNTSASASFEGEGISVVDNFTLPPLNFSYHDRAVAVELPDLLNMKKNEAKTFSIDFDGTHCFTYDEYVYIECSSLLSSACLSSINIKVCTLANCTFSYELYGVECSSSINDAEIKAEFGGFNERPSATDYTTVIALDLDIDSDNDNGYDTPDMDEEEEVAQEESSIGKIIKVYRKDEDNDGVPNIEDMNAGGDFVPMVVKSDTTATAAKFKFTFNESKIRIWIKDGNSGQRTNELLRLGGDLIEDDEEYEFDELFSSG